MNPLPILPIALRLDPLSEPDGHDIAELRRRCSSPDELEARAARRVLAEWAFDLANIVYSTDAASTVALGFLEGPVPWLDAIEKARLDDLTNSEYVRLIRNTARWRQLDQSRGRGRGRAREVPVSDEWMTRLLDVMVPEASNTTDPDPRWLFADRFADADYIVRIEMLIELGLTTRAAEAIVLYSLGTPTQLIADRFNMRPAALRKLLERARRQVRTIVAALPDDHPGI